MEAETRGMHFDSGGRFTSQRLQEPLQARKGKVVGCTEPAVEASSSDTLTLA